MTAILAADIAGYSRLVGLNEEGTMACRKLDREVTLADWTAAMKAPRAFARQHGGLE